MLIIENQHDEESQKTHFLFEKLAFVLYIMYLALYFLLMKLDK